MIRVCLNMIVKNESARIERCLASVVPHIHCWAVLDTGSTDGTQALIRDFFGAHRLPGHLSKAPFKNFRDSRNEALELAKKLRGDLAWDYLLFCDADMELIAPEGLGQLTAPGYQMLQKSGLLEYWNARLVRWDNKCRYETPTHEYLSTEKPLEKLHSAYFIDHADGANRSGKVLRDVEILEEELRRNPSDGRCWFYLANSFRELGQHEKAFNAYMKRVELGGWVEEVYCALLYAARCRRALGYLAQGGNVSDYSSTDLALRAFETCPTRLEALADLARNFRERGMNEVASLFARRGIGIPPSEDILFVETWAHTSLAEDLSISGFYSVDPEIRQAGAAACDALALDRSVSRETRDLARRNLHFYLRHISEVFPSWRARRLNFAPPPGYAQMAPSVTRHGTRLVAALRTVTYKIDARGYVRIADDLPLTAGGRIHTRTFLVELDPETLADSSHGEILLPADLPPALNDTITGFEDMRLFSWCGELWGLSTVLDQNPDARGEQWLARIGSDLRMCEARPINPQPLRARDKNWIPVVDGSRLRFVYQSDPTRIIDMKGETIAEHMPSVAAEHLSGSSQAIPFAGGWLAVVHWREWFDGWPKYRHRFAWFDPDLRLQKLSAGWVFSNIKPELPLLEGYEYCTGICWHPDEHRLVLGFQIHEREAWVGTFDAADVLMRLQLGETKKPRTNVETEPAVIEPLRMLKFDDDVWVRSQTGRPLQNVADVDRATTALRAAGLLEHPDRVKNWDTYLALQHALKLCPPTARVLDAAGDRRSAFLPALARLGYTKLKSINLEEEDPGISSGVEYLNGDITQTGLLPASLDFIACLSVLEHGVDTRSFFSEMARVLAPGGHLFLSVDYWEWEPVSTSHVVFLGKYAGQRWEIFTQATLAAMIGNARREGFVIVGDVDYRCRERVCHHLGCDFTFFSLLLRR